MIARWLMYALIAAMVGSGGAVAQEPAGERSAPDAPLLNHVLITGVSDREFPRITVQFELVRPDGTFIRDAQKRAFSVSEEGRPAAIESFQAPVTTEAIPTTVVLVVDRSGSMLEEDRIGGLKRAVASFLDRLPAGSRVALVSFASDVEVASRFTDDLGRVRDAVDDLEPEGATRFYDAVDRALGLLEDQTGRRAVLALTDGLDTASESADAAAVIEKAQRLGLPIYTLGLGSEDQIRGRELRAIASATRGQYYPARRADELRALYEQIAERIGATYYLSYRTDRPVPDGTLRPIRIAYLGNQAAAETAVFIPGMVAPVGGWAPLFLGLAAMLLILLLLIPRWARPAAVHS